MSSSSPTDGESPRVMVKVEFMQGTGDSNSRLLAWDEEHETILRKANEADLMGQRPPRIHLSGWTFDAPLKFTDGTWTFDAPWKELMQGEGRLFSIRRPNADQTVSLSEEHRKFQGARFVAKGLILDIWNIDDSRAFSDLFTDYGRCAIPILLLNRVSAEGEPGTMQYERISGGWWENGLSMLRMALAANSGEGSVAELKQWLRSSVSQPMPQPDEVLLASLKLRKEDIVLY